MRKEILRDAEMRSGERTSGVSRTPGKRVRANSQRGFEARPLLQAFMTNGPLWPVSHFYLSPPIGCVYTLGRVCEQFFLPRKLHANLPIAPALCKLSNAWLRVQQRAG